MTFLMFFFLLSFERVLLLSTASPPRYRGRCWAAIRLSYRPEPSGGVVRGEVDGLDSGGWHGRRFVLRQTHRGGHNPFVQAGAETSDTGAEAVELEPGSSWEGHSGCVCTGVWNWSAESCGIVMIRPLRRTYVVVVRKRSSATKLSRLHACENWKVVRWCRTQASSHNSQSFVDDGVNKAGMSTAAPDRSAVLCSRMDQG